MRSICWVRVGIAAILAIGTAGFGQNFSTDARRIGMGGAGDAENMASKLIEAQQPYRSIGLPLGLIQVLQKRNVFNPDHDDFDPVLAIEYAANPLHLTVRRDSGGPGGRFVKDLVDAKVNRDLNTYRGFAPSPEINSAGLWAPTWGKTIRFKKEANESFHGIHFGVGPYLSMQTRLGFDPDLINLLASPTNVYTPNATFDIDNDSAVQGAAAATIGYRGKLPLFGKLSTGAANEGVYIAADYHYIHGLQFEDGDLRLRFNTDSQGLIALAPSTTPLVIQRDTAKSGKGFAVDMAMALVTERWDLGFGVDGVGNRINWKDFSRRTYTLTSLFNGGDFVDQTVPSPESTRRVTLPVRVSGNGGYHTDRWSAAAEVADTLQGFSMNAGGEYVWRRLAFRGGGRYSRDLWHGASGIGFNFTKKFGIDVAAFQTSTNIEEERRLSYAVSLRFNRELEPR